MGCAPWVLGPFRVAGEEIYRGDHSVPVDEEFLTSPMRRKNSARLGSKAAQEVSAMGMHNFVLIHDRARRHLEKVQEFAERRTSMIPV